jgi:hypothetical protein
MAGSGFLEHLEVTLSSKLVFLGLMSWIGRDTQRTSHRR